MEKIRTFSNFTHFGSGEKRFSHNEFKIKKDTPGPGTYNPEKIKSHINTKKMIKSNYYNNLLSKIYIFINLKIIAIKNYEKR